MKLIKEKALSLIIMLILTLIPILYLGGTVRLIDIPLIVFTVVVYRYVLIFVTTLIDTIL